MPWRIEDELKAIGANYIQAGLWKGFAVRDGNLITGQQSQSGMETANALPANTYDNNLCELSLIGPSPGQDICKLPNIAGHRNGPVDHN